jgi:two-component system heavy metal sensor histidine kinase CusS
MLFALLSTLILLGLGLFLQQAVERHFLELDEEELHGNLALVRRVLAETPATRLDEAIPRLASLMPASRQSLSVMDAAGMLRYSGAAIPPAWLLHAGKPAALNETRPPTRQGQTDEQRGILALARLGDGQVAQVAITMSVAHHLHFMAGFIRSLVWALGLAVLANILCAGYAARRGLSPLETMATLARRVSGERLHERLAAQTLPLELQPLGGDLNAMLDRLEDAFARLSGFASDIAHELRTPLTAMMTQAQVTLARTDNPEQCREALYSLLEECERLSHMVGDMLFLAQADNGLMVLRRDNIDLAALVQALVEFYGILAEEKEVGLTVEGAAPAHGDAPMLRRALGNLISNAISHTAPGGRVHLRLRVAATGETLVEVDNQGEPIPPQHLARIFERFYRIDPARQRAPHGGGTGGIGLGLAIARSIALAHGGDIEAANAQGVTRFTLRLPAPEN